MTFALPHVGPSSAAPAPRARDRDGAPTGAAAAEPGAGAAPRDRVTLSPEAQERAAATGSPRAGTGEARDAADASPGAQADPSAEKPEQPGKTAQDRAAARASGKYTPDEQRQLTELRQRDTHVRQHEAAHQAAGGALVGGASYSYQTGPDGKSYAVGGEVPISMHAGRTSDETIAIARRVRAAALAPSDPSVQDLSVAAAATSMELAAGARKAREATRAYARNGAAKAADRAPPGTTGKAAAPAQAA